MIDVYYSISPNVTKVYMLLEELGVPYNLIFVNVWSGDHFGEAFRALNPNCKIPVIVDHRPRAGDRQVIFESGAILIYLAEKYGSDLYPAEEDGRYDVLQWLMIQLTGIGPIFGQVSHFVRFAPQEKYSVSRYVTEQVRLFDLIDERLGNAAYLGGEKYSIADISAYPWFLMQRKMYPNNAMPHAWMDPEWPGHPNLARWFRAVSGRPAVKRSLEVLEKTKSSIGSATPDMVDRITGRGSYARG